jgi:Dickkopf N-terminal cysteine-rich region
MRFALFLLFFVCFAVIGGGCGGSLSPTPPATGMPCAFDEQCAGARCSASGDGCGVCLTPRKLGEACTGLLDTCARSATCTNGACVSTKKVVGQTCALGPGGLLPVDQKECDDELYCEAPDFTSGSGICRAVHGKGEACSLFGQCGSGLRCVNDTCVPGPGKLGEPCGPYPGCADDTLECNSLTMTCQTGTLPLGEACGIVGGSIIDPRCAPPNVCWTANGMTQTICVTLPGEGEPCARYQCAAPLFCRMKNDNHDTCERPRNEGEACAHGNYGAIPCATGLECRGSVCRPACR